MRLVLGSQRSRSCALRVMDRRPVPAVLTNELAPVLSGEVADVQTEEGQLRVLLLEACVGDRLAIARASPGGPGVDEHRPSAEVRERQSFAFEREPRNRWRRPWRPLAAGLARRAEARVDSCTALDVVATWPAVEEVGTRAAAQKVLPPSRTDDRSRRAPRSRRASACPAGPRRASFPPSSPGPRDRTTSRAPRQVPRGRSLP